MLSALVHDLHMTLTSIYARERQHISSEQSVDAREQALHALVHDLHTIKLDARVHYSLSVQ